MTNNKGEQKVEMPKHRTCYVCGCKATERIRFPIRLDLCQLCSREIQRGLRRKGLHTVVLPHGSGEADVRASALTRLGEHCDLVGVWVARDLAEYERARELGIIAGWASWEAYDRRMKATLSAAIGVNVVVLDASPEQVVASLNKHGLPNTSEGRSRVFAIMAAEQALRQ